MQILETKRLVLRPWRESDAETLFKYASDPEVGPRAGWQPHKSVEESLDIIRNVFCGEGMWAVELKETSEVIGCVGYLPASCSNLDIGDDQCEVGYWIARPYWGKGICTEAMRAVVDYCFNVKGFSVLWGDFFPENPASGRVMEKCGFADTGHQVLCPNLEVGADKPVRVMRLEYALCTPKRFTFNTIALFTRDNRSIVDFYTGVFGFTTDWDGVQPNVEMKLDGMRILLFPRTEFERMVSRAFTYPDDVNGTMEISFDVPTYADVDREFQLAVSQGAMPVLEPTTEPWGQRTCYVADPDGNLIEISSFTV